MVETLVLTVRLRWWVRPCLRFLCCCANLAVRARDLESMGLFERAIDWVGDHGTVVEC
jgi:hypothetical protein